MKERLSNMIQSAVGGCAKNWADTIATHLLAEGVIVSPCENPEKVAIVVFSTDGTSHTYYGNMELRDIALAKHEIELDIIDKFIAVNADRYNQTIKGE